MILACWFMFSCNTYKADNLPTKQLLFGNGGGVTGAVKEFILLDNGQIFTRTSFAGTPTKLGKISKKQAKAIYASYDQKLKSIELIKPGNQYKYIQMNIDSTQNYRQVWGKPGETPPEEVLDFYEQLTGLVKGKKK